MEMTFPGSGRSIGRRKTQSWSDMHGHTLTSINVDRGDMDIEFHTAEKQHTNNMKNGSAPYEHEAPIGDDWSTQKDEEDDDSAEGSFIEQPAPTGNPELWIKANQTVAWWVFWLVIALQIGGAFAWAFFIKSSYEGQLHWRTGCRGTWIGLPEVSGNAFVEFTTSIGWKGYGDGENVSNLNNIDHSSAYMGLFTAGTMSLSFFMGILV
eukprot:253948_1